MTHSISIWTLGPDRRTTSNVDGRIPGDVHVVALSAPDVPADATLELHSPGCELPAHRVAGPPGPSVWLIKRAQLQGNSRWWAVLLDGARQRLAARELLLVAALPAAAQHPPTPSEIVVEALLKDGTSRPAADVPADDVQVLVVTAIFPPTDGRADLYVHVEGPGVEWTGPLEPADDLWARTRAFVDPPTFSEGDWTVSVLRADRTLIRRVRLRMTPPPLRVRAAKVVALGTAGANAVGPSVEPALLEQRLVFVYALDGIRPGLTGEVALAVTDLEGARLARWSQTVDRGDGAALARVSFPCPSGRLAGARGALDVRLELDGVVAHTQRLEVVATTFRSDGTVISVAPTTGGQPADLDAARGFFGLPRRPRRRRPQVTPPPASGPAAPPPQPPDADGDLPF